MCFSQSVRNTANLQNSLKGQIPGKHCYNQLFQLVYFYNKGKSQYLHMFFTSTSWHFLSDYSLSSLSKCKFCLGWKLLCPTATSFQTIQVWSYEVNGRHLLRKGPVGQLHICYLCQKDFLPYGSTVARDKRCISWVLAMEITQCVICLL